MLGAIMSEREQGADISAGKRPYFGYGSNLDVAEMQGRCPGAELVGIARLMGWKVYMDSNGYATIAEDGGYVEGTLWLVSDANIAALDEYEGLDRGLYEKREIEVELNGERWNALVYVSLRLPLTMETFRPGTRSPGVGYPERPPGTPFPTGLPAKSHRPACRGRRCARLAR